MMLTDPEEMSRTSTEPEMSPEMQVVSKLRFDCPLGMSGYKALLTPSPEVKASPWLYLDELDEEKAFKRWKLTPTGIYGERRTARQFIDIFDTDKPYKPHKSLEITEAPYPRPVDDVEMVLPPPWTLAKTMECCMAPSHIVMPPIYACAKGHLVCGPCINEIPCCAHDVDVGGDFGRDVCRQPFLRGRVLLVENLYFQFIMQCRWATLGCNFVVTGKGRWEHEEKCTHNPENRSHMKIEQEEAERRAERDARRERRRAKKDLALKKNKRKKQVQDADAVAAARLSVVTHIEEGAKPAVTHLEEGAKPAVTHLEEGVKPAVTHLEEGAKPAVTHLEEGAKPAVTHLEEGVKPAVTHLEEADKPAVPRVSVAKLAVPRRSVTKPAVTHLEEADKPAVPRVSVAKLAVPRRSVTKPAVTHLEEGVKPAVTHLEEGVKPAVTHLEEADKPAVPRVSVAKLAVPRRSVINPAVIRKKVGKKK